MSKVVSCLTSLLFPLWLLFDLLLDLLPWLLINLLLLLLGVYLILKRSGILRTLGILSLLVFAYFNLRWISPWYVISGTDQVQEFSLNSKQLGEHSTVMWMDTPPRLLLVPDEITSTSYDYNQESRRSLVLVADLNARQTQLLSKTAINFSESSMVKRLDYSDYTSEQIDSRGNLSLFYASPSKVGSRSEFSFVGFSLPKWVYHHASFSFMGGEQPTGWRLERTYFGWQRLVVRESASAPVLVEVIRVFINSRRELINLNEQNWLFKGKFLVFEPHTGTGQRIFVLGPFNTSPNT